MILAASWISLCVYAARPFITVVLIHQGRDIMKHVLVVLFMAAAFSSCYMNPGVRTRTSSVVDAGRPFVHRHFSVMTPGNGWNVTETESNNQYKIYFHRRDSETHSRIGYVISAPVDYSFKSPLEFKKSFNDLWFKQYNDSRYRIIENSITHNTSEFGGYSLSHLIRYKDFQAVNNAGNDFLLSEGKEHVILHPNDRNVLIYISYSERGTEKELLGVLDAAERFISNCRIAVE